MVGAYRGLRLRIVRVAFRMLRRLSDKMFCEFNFLPDKVKILVFIKHVIAILMMAKLWSNFLVIFFGKETFNFAFGNFLI